MRGQGQRRSLGQQGLQTPRPAEESLNPCVVSEIWGQEQGPAVPASGSAVFRKAKTKVELLGSLSEKVPHPHGSQRSWPQGWELTLG